jgi:hypothetical protein
MIIRQLLTPEERSRLRRLCALPSTDHVLPETPPIDSRLGWRSS